MTKVNQAVRGNGAEKKAGCGEQSLTWSDSGIHYEEVGRSAEEGGGCGLVGEVGGSGTHWAGVK